MADGVPLDRLTLRARSVADDLGFVALADLARMLRDEAPSSYRIIGGYMVTALVARWQLGAELYRETGDADLGVPPLVVKDLDIVQKLSGLGYKSVAGDRFAKTVHDVPVRVVGEQQLPRLAFIDVLVPAYTSRPRRNRRIGPDLVTIEVSGLAMALKRRPVTLTLQLHRMGGELTEAALHFPDEVSALVLKAFATRDRDKGTDVVDVWRCLEVAFAAGVGPADFGEGTAADGAAIVRSLFSSRDGEGMTVLVDEQLLSRGAADQRFTRTRALVERVLGGP